MAKMGRQPGVPIQINVDARIPARSMKKGNVSAVSAAVSATP